MSKFEKGYKNDAGVDIVLDKDVLLPAHSVKIINLNCVVTPQEGDCVILLPRTSSAKRGIYIASCPVDADYIGNIHAFVYNLSDTDEKFEKGTAFCQAVPIKLGNYDCFNGLVIRKNGKRTDGMLGSTGAAKE